MLGVYQLGKATVCETLGDRVPVEENPSVGLEEVPWIMVHWSELGPGRPPLARVVAAALEAQYRFLCAEGLVDDDPQGWTECTPEELAEAMRLFHGSQREEP